MNLHLFATINAKIKIGKKKKNKKITEIFDLYQTPTEVTRKILKSSDVKQAYIDWIKETPNEVKEPVYMENGNLEEPIRYEKYDYNDEHIKRLNQWIHDHEGWEIEFFEM